VSVFRISAWRPTSRSSVLPSRAPYSSTSIIRSTWYVTTATRQPTEIPPQQARSCKWNCLILRLLIPVGFLPLLSAETRDEEGGGSEEETVGGPAAREDSDQITILQRGQALSLQLPLLFRESPGGSRFNALYSIVHLEIPLLITWLCRREVTSRGFNDEDCRLPRPFFFSPCPDDLLAIKLSNEITKIKANFCGHSGELSYTKLEMAHGGRVLCQRGK